MKKLLSITAAAATLTLAGGISLLHRTNAVQPPAPAAAPAASPAPALPDPNDAINPLKSTNAPKVAKANALAVQSAAVLPSLPTYVWHIYLTGPGADRAQLPYVKSNYIFVLYTATNLSTPTNQWTSNYLTLLPDSSCLYTSIGWVLDFRGEFQGKDQSWQTNQP